MGSDRRFQLAIRPGRLAVAFRSRAPCAFYPAKSMPLLQRNARAVKQATESFDNSGDDLPRWIALANQHRQSYRSETPRGAECLFVLEHSSRPSCLALARQFGS